MTRLFVLAALAISGPSMASAACDASALLAYKASVEAACCTDGSPCTTSPLVRVPTTVCTATCALALKPMASTCADHISTVGLKATVDTAVALCPMGDHKCFLNRFRGYTLSQANEQRIQYAQNLDLDSLGGGIAFDIAIIAAGLLLCFFGWKLTQWAVFITGFSTGAYIVFQITSWVMNLSGAFDCWALGLFPLLGGIIGVCLANKFINLAFFAMGCGLGATIGVYFYSLVVASWEQTSVWIQENHNLVYLFTICFPAGVLGIFAVKSKEKIFAIATAFIGGLMVAVGITYLLVARFNEKYAYWLSPCMFKANGEACTDDGKQRDINAAVIVPVFFAITFSILGLATQFHLQSKAGFHPGSGTVPKEGQGKITTYRSGKESSSTYRP